MAELYKLENEIKHYAWGSPDMIPVLTGKANPEKEPWAELWMGTHPGGPSKVTVGKKNLPLSELTELPFLFKFLAAEKPLSIQAHPNSAQAREGFEKENKKGIPLSAADRNYRDPGHKPEIICALSPFTAMAGFREKTETERLLSMISGTENLKAALKEGYQPFLFALFNLNYAEKKALHDSVLNALIRRSAAPGRSLSAAMENPAENDLSLIRLCGELAQSYPGDPGIISPLYLNVIKLKPYEALFLPAGILHAYIHGFAVECMANSDNVLRGGLTPKHIDIQELFSILSFEPYKPPLLKPVQTTSAGCFSYKKCCREFSLFLVKNPAASEQPALPDGIKMELPEKGIAAVYDGAVEISIVNNGKENKPSRQKTIVLNKGESAFIGRRKEEERIFFSGNFTLFFALAPK